MKHKRGKKIRRLLRYYQVNFGLSGPFKVLFDGVFLESCVAQQIPLVERVEALLQGSRALLYSSPCVKESAGMRLGSFKCPHIDPLTPNECLLSVIEVQSKISPGQLIACFQSEDIRKLLRKQFPSIPIIFFNTSGVMDVENPSKAAQEALKSRISIQSQGNHVTVPVEPKASSFVTRKRKVANPLSCKKRKVNQNVNANDSQRVKRKRVRSKTVSK